MKTIIKILTNGRVMSAVISALGAIVSAMCAGCKLYCGELAIKDFECAITGTQNVSTNDVKELN